MTNPQVSIIVPVYNQEKYLEECLDSLVNQTYDNIEIICINDGSTDNSWKILQKYAHKYLNVFAFKKKNGGLSSARNKGLSLADGEFVMFVDSDDWLDKDVVEKAMLAQQKNKADIVVFSMEAYNDGKIQQDLSTINSYTKLPYRGYRKCKFETALKTNIHVCNKLFSIDLIEDLLVDDYYLNFKEGLLYEDIYFMWQCFFRAERLFYLPSIKYHYRIHQGSIMESSFKEKSYEKAIDHLRNWYELFRNLVKYPVEFKKHYEDLVYLLDKYDRNTKRMCYEQDYDKVNVVYQLYKEELNRAKRRLS